jgi:hypothetical protein
MSYALRGNSCNCSSIALTSNAKYIPPLSKVYYDRWTDMWLYPGYTGFTYPFQHPFGPEVLKAWNLEMPFNYSPGRRIIYQDGETIVQDTNPDVAQHEKHTHKENAQQKRSSCHNCSTHN